MKKILFLLLTMLLALPLVAEELDTDIIFEDLFSRSYNTGDQIFSMSGGLTIPLFGIHFSDAEDSFTNLLEAASLGFNGNIEWAGFVNTHWRLGFEFGFQAFFDRNNQAFLSFPLYFKPSYVLQFNNMEVPLSFGTGLALLKLGQRFHLGPVFIPQAEFYYHYSYEWSFGAKIRMPLYPEIYFNKDFWDKNFLGSFLHLNFSAIYHIQ